MITVSSVVEHIGLSNIVDILLGRVEGDLDTDVFLAVVNSEPTGDFVVELVEVANAAVTRVELAITSAQRQINGYITKRYPNGLTAAEIEDSPLPNIAQKLVKYELMVEADDDTRANKKYAMTELRDIANGLISLGASDPAKTTSKAITTAQSTSRFDWGGFGR